MKKLYLQTKRGAVPIDQNVAQKYSLRAGTLSPFTHSAILGKVDAPSGKDPASPERNEVSMGELAEGEISELDNGVTLSTSEIIDFSQGVDSQME